MMTDQWYQFRAYNTETLYGFGTEEEAEKFIDHLNRNREINVYGVSSLTDDDGAEIAKRSDAFCLADELAARADQLVDDILQAPNLDSLYRAIVEFREHYGDNASMAEREYGVDMAALPTFGGSEPPRTDGIWSWDKERLLVGEGNLDIVSREAWADR